jgi:5-hydroxyisourate hydrolase-like protein (transthyretin family)
VSIPQLPAGNARLRRATWLGVSIAATGLIGIVGFRNCQTRSTATDGLAEAERASLSAHVHDHGRPIARAQVRASTTPNDFCEAETDESGRAQLEDCPVGATTVVIEASGFVRVAKRYELMDGDNGLEQQLAPGARIEGKVADDQGQPLLGARIDLRPLDAVTGEESADVWSVTSVAGGSFACDTLPAGLVSVQATLAPYESVTVPRANVPSPQLVSITLQRMAAVTGVVVGPDKQPLAAASIRLAGSGIWPARATLSDARGQFQFSTIPAGVYELSAARGELVSAPFEGVSVEAGDEVKIELSLGQGRVLKGSIREAASGRPLAGAQIKVAEDALTPAAQETRSGMDGAFELRGLRWIEQRVHIALPGFVPIETIWGPSDPPLRAALLRAGTIRGRVEDGLGRAVADAELELVGQTTTGSPLRLQNSAPLMAAAGDPSQLRASTPVAAGLSLDNLGVTQGAVPPIPLTPTAAAGPAPGTAPGFRTAVDGSFELSGIPAGEYRVVARRAGFVANESAAFRLAAGAALEGVEVALNRGGTVSGRVFDRGRRPVPQVHVSLTSGSESPRSTLTDESGSFEFEAVPPRATLIVQPIGQPQTVVDVAVDADGRKTLAITIDDHDASLRGRVVDTYGDPVAGARVRVEATNRDARLGSSVVSARDGTFEISGLPDPPYSVRADHANYAPSPAVHVTDPAQAVQLTLDSGQPVTGTVLDRSSGEPIAGARVSLRRGGQSDRVDTDRQGRFEFRRVARGTYQLVADASGHLSQTRALEIEGERRLAPEVEFELNPAGSLSGEVVDRIGAPVWNAEVAVGAPPDWAHAVRTDHEGHFVLRGLPAGDALVSARKGDASGEGIGARVHEGVDTPGVIVRFDQTAPEDEEETSERDAPPAAAPSDPSVPRAVEATDPRAPLGLARRGDAVVVERVAPGSSAERLGLRPGDVLAAINGEQVHSPAQARGMLGLPPRRGGYVIDVRRAGEQFRLRYAP